jgi:hypothetical protein
MGTLAIPTTVGRMSFPYLLIHYEPGIDKPQEGSYWALHIFDMVLGLKPTRKVHSVDGT